MELYTSIPAVAVNALRSVVVRTLGVKLPVVDGQVILPLLSMTNASDLAIEVVPFAMLNRRSAASHATAETGAYTVFHLPITAST